MNDATPLGTFLRPARRHAWFLLASALLIAGASRAARADEEDVYFETHVRPIVKAQCIQCHGEEEEHEGNLDLRLVRLMLQGGDSGPVVVAHKPKESLLVERITNDEMPPGKKKLSAEEKAVIERWIAQGARTRRAEPADPAAADEWTEEERSHWAFQPIQRPPLPSVAQPERVSTPIDAFLLAKLEAEGLSFSQPVDRRALARRLSFDLLGLPPSPERVEAFVNDTAPDAYARLVEEFLASPAYGERWARHWLDPAGYADSNGYTEKDSERPWAFRYRDYVVRALNADLPLDQFIIEQLAGDELLSPPYTNLSPQDAERLAATGFLRMAPDGTGDGGVDQNVARNDVVAETIKIVSSTLLGVTVGCAQCHNHRYDPISQADYYRMRAVFEPALDWKNWRAPAARRVSLWTTAEQEQAAAVDAELRTIDEERKTELDQIVADIFEREVAKLPAEQQSAAREARAAKADQRTPEQQQLLKDHPSLNVSGGSAYLYEPKRLNEFNKKYEELKAAAQAKRPAESFVSCLTEVPGKIPPTHLFFRGDINQPREILPPGDLSVLGELGATIPTDDLQLPTSGRRLAFARQLVNGQHPLVPRVLVNRVWMHHFGRGLVGTPSDFGVIGERPSHPALLDWLADELVRSGWRLKDLHRLMVLSTAYQQTSLRIDALQAKDPENRWLGRMTVRRLETEAIRDAILDVSGSREYSMFGPPSTVNPDEVGQIIIGKATRDGNGILVAKAENDPERFRRSLYVQVRRSMPLGMLEPFDVASTAPNCEVRPSSTVAPQSLLMMNSSFVLRQSERFAERVVREAGADRNEQVRRAWRLAFAADPSEADVADAQAFLTELQTHFEQQPKNDNDKTVLPAPEQALAVFCQSLLSSNRFLYVD